MDRVPALDGMVDKTGSLDGETGSWNNKGWVVFGSPGKMFFEQLKDAVWDSKFKYFVRF